MEKTIQKKTSLVTYSAWLAVLHFTIIISQSIIIMTNQFTFTAEDYLGTVYLPLLMNIVCLILLAAVGILALKQAKNKEKTDELANLHRYKAGYISKYICVIAIIAAVFIIKDFHFAFSGDVFHNLTALPVIILCFSEFVQHIVFIILEKRNLE